MTSAVEQAFCMIRNTFFRDTKAGKCVDMDTDEIATITPIPGLMNFHGVMNQTVKKYQFLIGGSFGLKLYTRREFVADDIDIICSAKNSTGDKTHTDSISLLSEAQTLRDIYGPETLITVKHRSDLNLVDETGKIISPVSGMPAVEDFDEFIVGTVNVKVENTKLQYVFVNKQPTELENWYIHTADLPVFAKITPDGTYQFQYKNYIDAVNATYGVLDGIKHEYRKNKYRAKGFMVN